jgi:hypothetical protein
MRQLLGLALALTVLSGCPTDPPPGDEDTGGGGGMDVGPVDAFIPFGTDVPMPRPDTPGVCVPTIEICGDRMDQDCNGRDTSCGDTDRDGIQACRVGDDLRLCDCDDARADVYPASGTGGSVPGGAEACDDVDNNCNGRIDEASACCDGCASLGAERDRGDVCTEDGTCDCSTEPGVGVCAAGETCCVSGCVNTDTDRANCGLCGAACTDQADRCVLGPSGRGECRCGTGPVCDFITMCVGGSCG